MFLQPVQRQMGLKGEPRLVRQPYHEGNAGIFGILLMAQEILQKRQRVLMLESLSGRR